MMQLAEEPRHASGSYIDRIASNTGQGRMITRFAAADRRFMGVSAGDGAPSYAFGYKPQNLRFYAPGVDVSLEEHVNIQPRVMYGLNSGTFRLYNARDIGVLDDAPAIGSRFSVPPGRAPAPWPTGTRGSWRWLWREWGATS
jgi:hypothetical protein